MFDKPAQFQLDKLIQRITPPPSPFDELVAKITEPPRTLLEDLTEKIAADLAAALAIPIPIVRKP